MFRDIINEKKGFMEFKFDKESGIYDLKLVTEEFEPALEAIRWYIKNHWSCAVSDSYDEFLKHFGDDGEFEIVEDENGEESLRYTYLLLGETFNVLCNEDHPDYNNHKVVMDAVDKYLGRMSGTWKVRKEYEEMQDEITKLRKLLKQEGLKHAPEPKYDGECKSEIFTLTLSRFLRQLQKIYKQHKEEQMQELEARVVKRTHNKY